MHECIKIYDQVDVEQFLRVLARDYDARPHVLHPNTFLIDQPLLPFRRPVQYPRYLSILGFNLVPLSSLLIVALIDHPELLPRNTRAQWLSEQEILLAGTLHSLATRMAKLCSA
jgi:hypothetical protein